MTSLCLQEPRHLQLLADLEDSNIFTVITGKKQQGAPTDYGFCIKVSRRPPLNVYFEFIHHPLRTFSHDELIVDVSHLQPNKCRGELKELRVLCAEDEQGRTCWMTAFRLFKVPPR